MRFKAAVAGRVAVLVAAAVTVVVVISALDTDLYYKCDLMDFPPPVTFDTSDAVPDSVTIWTARACVDDQCANRVLRRGDASLAAGFLPTLSDGVVTARLTVWELSRSDPSFDASAPVTVRPSGCSVAMDPAGLAATQTGTLVAR